MTRLMALLFALVIGKRKSVGRWIGGGGDKAFWVGSRKKMEM